MTAFKHVLVTTDFSEASEVGIRTARDLATQLGAKISLVHVGEEILPPLTFSTANQRAEIQEQNLKTTKKKLATFARKHFPKIPVETHFLKGAPHSEIVECAEEVGADLIVMASQGRGSVGQFLFGSTTQRVIQLAKVPVVSVRPQAV